MDTSHNFVLRSATSGGVVVEKFERKSLEPETIGAFTTPADMIAWLAEQYGLQSHPTPKPEMTVSITVDAPADPDWTPWNGGDIPVPVDTKVEVKFRHGGTIRHRAGFWSWGHASEPHPSDVIAYRLV